MIPSAALGDSYEIVCSSFRGALRSAVIDQLADVYRDAFCAPQNERSDDVAALHTRVVDGARHLDAAPQPWRERSWAP